MKPATDQINRPTIQCPFCDGIHHHVMCVGTELDPSGDENELYQGTSLVFERPGTGERRSAVRIDFRGECGHFWSLILQQHKGVNIRSSNGRVRLVFNRATVGRRMAENSIT